MDLQLYHSSSSSTHHRTLFCLANLFIKITRLFRQKVASQMINFWGHRHYNCTDITTAFVYSSTHRDIHSQSLVEVNHHFLLSHAAIWFGFKIYSSHDFCIVWPISSSKKETRLFRQNGPSISRLQVRYSTSRDTDSTTAQTFGSWCLFCLTNLFIKKTRLFRQIWFFHPKVASKIFNLWTEWSIGYPTQGCK